MQSLEFLVRDQSYTDYQLRYERDHPTALDLDDGITTQQQQMEFLHDIKLIFMKEDAWRQRFSDIKEMTLDRLQLSLEDCYCPVGCCRQVAWVCEQLCNTCPEDAAGMNNDPQSFEPFSARPPRIIEFQGWLNRAERHMIKTQMKVFQQRYKEHDVQISFVGRSKRNLTADHMIAYGFDEHEVHNIREVE